LIYDNGAEFTSLDFKKWAARHRIDVQHIEPGKAIQNAFCESLNGSFRDECLNTTWFWSPSRGETPNQSMAKPRQR
jgi:putative transposase